MKRFRLAVGERLHRHEEELDEVKRVLRRTDCSEAELQSCWNTCIRIYWDAAELTKAYAWRIYSASGFSSGKHHRPGLANWYYKRSKQVCHRAEKLCREIKKRGAQK